MYCLLECYLQNRKRTFMAQFSQDWLFHSTAVLKHHLIKKSIGISLHSKKNQDIFAQESTLKGIERLFIQSQCKSLRTVGSTWNLKKQILCTKSPNLTMLFYYIKMWTSSSPFHPFLQLTGALKWGTVWTSTSTGIETMHGQS